MSDENSIVDLKKFLGTAERPVEMDEFQEFWRSLTEAEKEQFRAEQLPPTTPR